MMIRLLFATLALAATLGCGNKPTPPAGATLTVWGKDGLTETTYQVPPEGLELLDSIMAAKPDGKVNGSIELAPSGLIVLDGQNYAIESNKVILLGAKATLTWKRDGIQQQLIEFSKEQKGNPTR